MNYQIVFSCLALLVLWQPVFSGMKVLSPSSLANQFGNQDFHFSYANFGKIPYGSVLAGRVFYFPNNPDGCQKFEGVTFDREGDPDQDFSPIVIIGRAGCTFVRKVKNVQEMGGALAVIVDLRDNENPENLVMIDDGTGGSIVIPSILISKEHGSRIIASVQQTELANKVPGAAKQYVALMVDFTMENPDDRVEYDIWYDSISQRSLDFISKMRKYNTRLGKHALMTPHVLVWKCGTCTPESFQKNCIKYPTTSFCAPPMQDAQVSGIDILQAGLLERCIYKTYLNEDNAKSWWDYMDYLQRNCAGKSYTNDCSARGLQETGIEKARMKTCLDKGQEFFEQEREDLMNIRIPYFPAVIINNRVYRGALDPDFVFKSICAGFNATPDVCYDDYQDSTGTRASSARGIGLWAVVGIIVGVISINVLLIYCYRRYTKREMREEMQTQISTIMAQYMQITDKREVNLSMTATTTKPQKNKE